MDLTVKEKEKYVLKLREEGKTYRDNAHELLISPREIIILKLFTMNIDCI